MLRRARQGWLRVALLLLLPAAILARHAKASKPSATRQKEDLLGDLLKPVEEVTAEDIPHANALGFVLHAVEQMRRRGVQPSPLCDARYGWQYIASQKAHHFRICIPTNASITAPEATQAGRRAGVRLLLEQSSGGGASNRSAAAEAHDGAGEDDGGDDEQVDNAADGDGGDITAPDDGQDSTDIAVPSLLHLKWIEPDNVTVFPPPHGDKLLSSVGCYTQPYFAKAAGQSFCVARNVALDTCAYYDGERANMQVRWPKPRHGALRLACSIVPRVRSRLLHGTKNKIPWTKAWYDDYDNIQTACNASSGLVVEHPVVFVMRDRFAHTLHELDVMTNIFTSLAVADLPEVRARGFQVIIADSMPHASYRPTYEAMSYPYRLRHLAEQPFPNNTCFRTALFISGFMNSIATNNQQKVASCYSPLLVAFNAWLRTLHRELDPTHLAALHAHAADGAANGIVRRAVVWTSRRTLDALRADIDDLSVWRKARLITNENALVVALQATVLQWNSRSCLLARYYRGKEGMAGCRNSSVQFDFVFGEFSDVPYYPDQLSIAFRTGVFVGVHGAALTFVAACPPGECAVVELIDVHMRTMSVYSRLLNLFPSLVSGTGNLHQAVDYENKTVAVEEATAALARAMDEVARNITAARTEQRAAAAAAAKGQAVSGGDQLKLNDQFNFEVMYPETCDTPDGDRLRRYESHHLIQLDVVAANGSASRGLS